MHILMISDVYFPRVNGVSTSIQTFARELQRQGHSVTLIAPDYGAEHNDELEVMRVPSRKVIVDPEDRMLKMDWVMERVDLLAKCEYDLIHIQTPFVAHYLGLKLARELQLPVVETYHTYFEEYLGKYLRWLPNSLLRAMARRGVDVEACRVDPTLRTGVSVILSRPWDRAISTPRSSISWNK